jgi:hypothetical protein
LVAAVERFIYRTGARTFRRWIWGCHRPDVDAEIPLFAWSCHSGGWMHCPPNSDRGRVQVMRPNALHF